MAACCPNAEFMLSMTFVATATGQGVIQAHFGRDTCKESDAIAQGCQFILEHRYKASLSDLNYPAASLQGLVTSLLLYGVNFPLLRNPDFKAAVN